MGEKMVRLSESDLMMIVKEVIKENDIILEYNQFDSYQRAEIRKIVKQEIKKALEGFITTN